jgi:cellulose 1,4-beta-cellobiosidase
VPGARFIVDTGRAGVPKARSGAGSWCNVAAAGLGPEPQASPSPLVDAYVWVKPPGESDGTSDPASPRFDKTCAGPDAAPGAPEAGKWFQSYFAALVDHAPAEK